MLVHDGVRAHYRPPHASRPTDGCKEISCRSISRRSNCSALQKTSLCSISRGTSRVHTSASGLSAVDETLQTGSTPQHPVLPPLPSSYAPALRRRQSALRASHHTPPRRHPQVTVTRYSSPPTPFVPPAVVRACRGAVWLLPFRLSSLAPDLWSLLLCPPPPGTAPLHPSALVLGRARSTLTQFLSLHVAGRRRS
ncbi:hypothetical protein IQ06DRAFT_133409 [Phaeosphaeriaceae sp. SRC1lsM3a]|nr:hypothetical protein IQ06DRAFT_133409 [Stagonospora sp. SRC1lsM3a]